MGSPNPSQFSTFGNRLDPIGLYEPSIYSLSHRGMGTASNPLYQSMGSMQSSNMMGGTIMSSYPLVSSSLQQQQHLRLTHQSRPQQNQQSSISIDNSTFNMGRDNLLLQLSAASQQQGYGSSQAGFNGMHAGLNQTKYRLNTDLLALSGVLSGVTQGNNFSQSLGDTSSSNNDRSEYSSLWNRGTQQNHSSAARNYLSMINKTAQGTSAGFQIQQEDFPALPGSHSITNGHDQTVKDSSSTAVSSNGVTAEQLLVLHKQQQQGTAVKIPTNMVPDQFGIVGLLTFLRASSSNPNLEALAPGIDLTTLGLNLNSTDTLYTTFHTPWLDSPCRPQDMDCHIPQDYITNSFIQEALASIRFDRYHEDLLFYLFYVNPGDILQLAAAAELYNRDWRYHKAERFWLTRSPGMEPTVKSAQFEKGTYVVFDVHGWKKVPKEIHLEYNQLEEKPQLPDIYPIKNKINCNGH